MQYVLQKNKNPYGYSVNKICRYSPVDTIYDCAYITQMPEYYLFSIIKTTQHLDTACRNRFISGLISSPSLSHNWIFFDSLHESSNKPPLSRYQTFVYMSPISEMCSRPMCLWVYSTVFFCRWRLFFFTNQRKQSTFCLPRLKYTVRAVFMRTRVTLSHCSQISSFPRL